MERTRPALAGALLVALSIVGLAWASGGAPEPWLSAPVADVTWPPSTLLVSEVQTGGTSASDEFAELTNVGPATVDLAGLEVVYVTSTGGTVTRKASWTATRPLDPGQHLLIANGSGIYAALADATYSGGFAATGGAIALRVAGGATIDAVGWGDATNQFVEGAAIAAPAAGTSVERLPGGLAGNTVDTNDNAVDWFAQPSPNPQSLAAPPVPAPLPSPPPMESPAPTASPTASEPNPTPAPSPSATPSETPGPTTAPSATPDAGPSATPDPSPSATPDPGPSATPSPTGDPTPTVTTPAPTEAPSPSPSLTPIPTPSATGSAEPSPLQVSIAEARGYADGTAATIVGVLTTSLGALEDGRKAFIQDPTGGIAVYLDATPPVALAAGTLVQASGTVDDRYSERTLRAAATGLVELGPGEVPAPAAVSTGLVGEPMEGARVSVAGRAVGSAVAMADGLGIVVDDGSGAVRVVVSTAALGGAEIVDGSAVTAIGPVGQRDSSGTGLAGYRVHATKVGELVVVGPLPSPSPVPSPTAPATPEPSATPPPGASSAPSATPSPTPAAMALGEARAQRVGAVVTVGGVVTAEAGRLGLPPVLAIGDPTGGILIRLPDGTAPLARGTSVVVRGPLADPYGQLEVRPPAGAIWIGPPSSLPMPLDVEAASLTEAMEGRLVTIVGTVRSAPRRATSGDLAVDLVDATGTPFRVMCDGSSGITPAQLIVGRALGLTGIVGQRASRKGELDGYRLWLRDAADIVDAGPGIPDPGQGQGARASATRIRALLALDDGSSAVIEAVVTAGTSLLDASGRRIVVADASGAIEVLLPVAGPAPAPGARLRIAGTLRHAWGAPRLAASDVTELGAGVTARPRTIQAPPVAADEWQLVRLVGAVHQLQRLGDRWRAEVTLAGGAHVPVIGMPGAGIPSTALTEGRRVTITGIVKRPYPTATDRRFAILPRTAVDLVLGAGRAGGGSATVGAEHAAGAPAIDVTPDTDLATLAEHVGEQVRVGGLVIDVLADGFTLDDGTAIGRVVLRDDMAALAGLMTAGEAVAATGIVELVDGTPVVVLAEGASLVRVGALGQAMPIVAPAGSGAAASPAVRSVTPSVEAGSIVAPDLPGASLLALAGITAMSLLVTLLRRRRVRLGLRSLLVARLGTLGEDRS